MQAFSTRENRCRCATDAIQDEWRQKEGGRPEGKREEECKTMEPKRAKQQFVSQDLREATTPAALRVSLRQRHEGRETRQETEWTPHQHLHALAQRLEQQESKQNRNQSRGLNRGNKRRIGSQSSSKSGALMDQTPPLSLSLSLSLAPRNPTQKARLITGGHE